MKATIDTDACIGCGLCVNDCPDIFEMAADKAAVKVTPVPAGREEACKSAAANCPVQCIKCE